MPVREAEPLIDLGEGDSSLALEMLKQEPHHEATFQNPDKLPAPFLPLALCDGKSKDEAVDTLVEKIEELKGLNGSTDSITKADETVKARLLCLDLLRVHVKGSQDVRLAAYRYMDGLEQHSGTLEFDNFVSVGAEGSNRLLWNLGSVEELFEGVGIRRYIAPVVRHDVSSSDGETEPEHTDAQAYAVEDPVMQEPSLTGQEEGEAPDSHTIGGGLDLRGFVADEDGQPIERDVVLGQRDEMISQDDVEDPSFTDVYEAVDDVPQSGEGHMDLSWENISAKIAEGVQSGPVKDGELEAEGRKFAGVLLGTVGGLAILALAAGAAFGLGSNQDSDERLATEPTEEVAPSSTEVAEGGLAVSILDSVQDDTTTTTVIAEEQVPTTLPAGNMAPVTAAEPDPTTTTTEAPSPTTTTTEPPRPAIVENEYQTDSGLLMTAVLERGVTLRQMLDVVNSQYGDAISLETFIAYNGITDPNNVQAGRVLRWNNCAAGIAKVIQIGQTERQLAVNAGVSLARLRGLNHGELNTRAGVCYFVKPKPQ